MAINLISYCCGRYPDDFGGVARFDYHLSLAVPDRRWFKGPQQQAEMVAYAKRVTNPIIITDNHLACDIPNEFPVILVHHGVARTHAERDPCWNEYWKNLCVGGQDRMLKYRSPENTLILSVSHFCIDEFSNYYPADYPKFEKILLRNTTELSPSTYKRSFNAKPIVLGNWGDYNKGANVIRELVKRLGDQFVFAKLSVPKMRDISKHNMLKERAYLNADIFLNLSLSEGFSYSMADAFEKNLLVATTNVGSGYDIPEGICAVIDWKRRDDVDYVADKLVGLWNDRGYYDRKAKIWFDKHCSLDDWKKGMRAILKEFYRTQYE